MKSIYILLTRTNDRMSRIVLFLTRKGYTHVAMSLEEDPDHYYTFNFRGYGWETLEKHRRRGVKYSRRYQIKIPDRSYNRIRELLQEFEANREQYRYTRFGVVCCFLHIPFRWKDHYFCSQFVAELLQRSGAIAMDRRPELVMPNYIMNTIERSGSYRLEMNIV